MNEALHREKEVQSTSIIRCTQRSEDNSSLILATTASPQLHERERGLMVSVSFCGILLGTAGLSAAARVWTRLFGMQHVALATVTRVYKTR